jgi:hypothetical protein
MKIKSILRILLLLLIFTGLYFGEEPAGASKESWFNLELNGKKIGYFYRSEEPVTTGGKKNIVLKEITFMKFRRGGNVMQIRTDSVNTLDHSGKLLHFSYQMSQGNGNSAITGNVDYDNAVVHLVHTRNGRERKQELQLKPGAMTDYQALRQIKKQGFSKVKSVDFTSLMTEKGSYIDVKMKVDEVRVKTVNGKKNTLYKIVRTLKQMPGVQSVSWIDAQLTPYDGRLILPGMVYNLKPASRDDALTMGARYGDIAAVTLARIKLNDFPPGTSREKVKRAVFLLKSKTKTWQGFRYDLDGGVQCAVPGNQQHTVRLTVDTHVPGIAKEIPLKSPAQGFDTYLKANSLIESDHEKIKAISRDLVVKGSAWKTAVNICAWVHANIKHDFKTGFASALQTLEAGTGDCTEHAVLTAALCRSVSIPTRIAFGYSLSTVNRGAPMFVGHMWNEVYMTDSWIPLDATSSSHQPDPFRIRFFASSLESREILEKLSLFHLTRDLEIYLLETQ